MKKITDDILEYLQSIAVGRDCAVKIRTIAARFGISTREVQNISGEIRRAGVPLCSTTRSPMGLYIARTYSEAMPWIQQIDSRLRKMVVNRNFAVKSLRKLAGVDSEQIEMELVRLDTKR